MTNEPASPPTSGYTPYSHPNFDPPASRRTIMLVRKPTARPLDRAVADAPGPADAPPAIVDIDEALTAINKKLTDARSGWQLNPVERGASNTRVMPVELTYIPPGVTQTFATAQNVVHLWETVTVLEPALLDPNLAGSPAYKPSAVTRGDFGRVPVALVSEPPQHTQVEGTRRRPVVALLDTAVGKHWWLGRPDPYLGGGGFWVDAATLGWQPGDLLLPEPGTSDDAIGRELEAQEGHGTFSAGLVRQIAPDSQVLAIRVMADNGHIYGHHVLNALGWIVDSGHLAAGDTVCLPFGFQPVLPADERYVHWLADVLNELAELRIKVVASAGNDETDNPAYPAAFAASTGVAEQVRMHSVGALGTDGQTHAYFSNYGEWVTHWEIGTSLVSTFPEVNGAAQPELSTDRQFSGQSHHFATADSDDFRGGFARWSGTSFATADPDDLRGGFARWSGTSFAAVVHAAYLARDAAGTGAE